MYHAVKILHSVGKTCNWRRVQQTQSLHSLHNAWCKYQSYWYGNAVALTICVNANELCSSPRDGRAVCANACTSTGLCCTAWIGDWCMSQRLGDLLVKEKIITPEQLEQANKVQKEQTCRLGSALVKLGFLTDEDVTNFLSRQYGVPAINLSYFEIDPAVVKLIPF